MANRWHQYKNTTEDEDIEFGWIDRTDDSYWESATSGSGQYEIFDSPVWKLKFNW